MMVIVVSCCHTGYENGGIGLVKLRALCSGQVGKRFIVFAGCVLRQWRLLRRRCVR